ncbi:MAG: hypothetical protein AAF282_11075 [Cyanobacteria bacterium P01_A01_bin.15]
MLRSFHKTPSYRFQGFIVNEILGSEGKAAILIQRRDRNAQSKKG